MDVLIGKDFSPIKSGKPRAVFKVRKIRQEQIDAAFDRIKDRAFARAVHKFQQHIKSTGRPLEGIDETFTQIDAEHYALAGYMDEINGLPMPALDGFGLGANIFKKAVNAIKKAVTKTHDFARKLAKKVAAPVVAAVVTIYAGPVAGKAAGTAVQALVNKYEYRNAVGKAKDKAKRDALVYASAHPEGPGTLPLGLTNEQAAIIVEGGIPHGFSDEKVWHTIQQAKLMAENNLPPELAYVAHYHGLEMDAPPITYTRTPDPKFAAELPQLNAKLQAKTPQQKIALDRAKRGVPDTPTRPWDYSDPSSRKGMLTETIIKRKTDEYKKILKRIAAVKAQIAATSGTVTFPGEKYVPETKPSIAIKQLPPAVITPVTEAVAAAPSKETTIAKTLSPEVTAKATEAATAVLRDQGIDVQSQAGQEALRLQVEQIQQQIASAIAKNQTLNIQPYEPPPSGKAITVEKTPDGDRVTIAQEKTGAANFVLPAIGLFLALKGA